MRADRRDRRDVRRRVPAPPLEPPLAHHRQVGVHVRGADRVGSRVEVCRVPGVDVEPVEGVADQRRRPLEVGRSPDGAGLVEEREPEPGVRLVEVRGAQLGVDDRASVDPRAGGHDPQRRELGCERRAAGRGLIACVRLPRLLSLPHLDLQAAPAEEVVPRVDARRSAVRVAQRDRERVGQVLPGRGRAPRVVAPVPQRDVQVRSREGRAPRVDAGSVHVLLHQDLGREIRHLRPEDRERMARRRPARRHDEGVRHRRRKGEQPGRGPGVGGGRVQIHVVLERAGVW